MFSLVTTAFLLASASSQTEPATASTPSAPAPDGYRAGPSGKEGVPERAANRQHHADADVPHSSRVGRDRPRGAKRY